MVPCVGIQDCGANYKAGAPIKGAHTEGVVWQPANFGRIKGGPHPNATLVFINWLLTKEGNAVFAQFYYDVPTRVGVGPFLVPGAVPDKMPPVYYLTHEEQLAAITIMKTGILEGLMKLPAVK